MVDIYCGIYLHVVECTYNVQHITVQGEKKSRAHGNRASTESHAINRIRMKKIAAKKNKKK